MALIAVHAVIDIVWVAAMRLGQPRLVRMATRALENEVVAWIRVAGGTNAVGVAVIHWEPGVIKRGSEPACSRVTGQAGCCKDGWRGLVDRIRSSSIIRGMATIAIRRESGVVVVYVATGARHLNVVTRQREGGGVVVECSIGPQSGVMAQIASRGKPDLNMVNRRGSCIVILHMACGASRARQVVIVVDVAVRAKTRGRCV